MRRNYWDERGKLSYSKTTSRIRPPEFTFKADRDYDQGQKPTQEKGAEMPRYDYRCQTCSETYELNRAMSDADAPATCSSGHVGAARLLPVFASTGLADSPARSGGGCCGGGCCN